MNDYLEFAKDLALQAGEIMLKHFGTNVSQHEKEDKQIVTIADEEINALVIQEINKKYPDHAIIGEEASDNKNSTFVWLCDPIDGTVPYSRGVPVSVFSLALVEDGKPIVGVVYDPYMKRLYSSSIGNGAYLNNQPIHVSSKSLQRHSIVNSESWGDAPYNIDSPLYKLAVDTNTYVVRLGSITHSACLVAAGKYEGAVFVGTVGKAVDIAAVKVIVEEAGGKVTDLFGNEQRYDNDIKGAIVSNGVVHEKLVQSLQNL